MRGLLEGEGSRQCQNMNSKGKQDGEKAIPSPVDAEVRSNDARRDLQASMTS